MNYLLPAIEALGIVTSSAIAFWEHRIIWRYQESDRRQKAERIEQKKIRQARRDHRASWEPAFRDVHEILKDLQDIESEIRRQGPVDQAFVGQARLKRIQWQLENVADRCPDALRGPLLAIASHVATVNSISFPSDAEVVNDYAQALASSAPGPIPKEIMASQLGARAIAQYSAAVELHEAIAAAWKAIHTERGGEA